MTAAQDTAAMMVRVAQGDTAAFHAVYVETVDEIERFVRSRADQSDVEDLVADAFVRAFRGAHSFQPQSVPVVAWIKTIARNVINSHYRRGARVDPQLLPTQDSRSAVADDELVIDFEDVRLIAQALLRIKERQRKILQLRFIDDLPVAACARELDITEQAVRALTYRSLQALREEFGSAGGTA